MWKLIKYVIQHRCYLFKNRNTSCILICCLFGIIKLFKFDITFVQLLNVFGTLYPNLIRRAKYDIVMKVDEIVTGFEEERGNIIEFYNNIFVIANNEYLVQIKNNILFHCISKTPFTPDLEDHRLSTTTFLTQDKLSVHNSIIEEAKRTLSMIQ